MAATSTRDRRPFRETLWRLMVSPRTASWLIGATTTLAVIGMVYPQRKVMTPAQEADWTTNFAPVARIGSWLGLDHLFTTWYFLAVLFALVVAVVACTLKRVRAHLRSRGARVSAPPPGSPSVTIAPPAGEQYTTIATLSRALSPIGALVRVQSADADEAGAWRAVLTTGRVGFWGSVLFHAALVMVAAGGLLTAFTMFNGQAIVTEGQTFVDEKPSYYRVYAEPRIGGAYTGSDFRLDKLDFIYEGDILTRSIAHVTVPASGGREQLAEVNYPFGVGSKSFLLGNSGYSVGLRIGAKGGVTESYYVLGQRRPAGYADDVELPGGVTAHLYAVPSESVGSNDELTRRYVLTDPVVHATLRATGRTLWEGVLRPNEPVTASGYQIMLTDVRFWNEFTVRADGGRFVVYAALWLVVLGLVLRLLDLERRVFVLAEGDELTITVRHRLGKHAGAALAQTLAERLQGAGSPSDDEED